MEIVNLHKEGNKHLPGRTKRAPVSLGEGWHSQVASRTAMALEPLNICILKY